MKVSKTYPDLDRFSDKMSDNISEKSWSSREKPLEDKVNKT